MIKYGFLLNNIKQNSLSIIFRWSYTLKFLKIQIFFTGFFNFVLQISYINCTYTLLNRNFILFL